MRTVKLVNRSKQTVLGEAVEVTDSARTRRRGLLGRTGLERGTGLWIVPTEAVHTFWMKFTIDLVFLNRKKRVTKVVHRLKPWRLAGSLRASSVVELPAGAAEESHTEAGDEIEVEEHDVEKFRGVAQPDIDFLCLISVN